MLDSTAGLTSPCVTVNLALPYLYASMTVNHLTSTVASSLTTVLTRAYSEILEMARKPPAMMNEKQANNYNYFILRLD